jgi:transketolase
MSLTPERIKELEALCRRFRVEALTAIHGVQSGHPGGSLSVCEILTLLYQERMNIRAEALDDPDRDRLVLCKGHAAPMLYCNLIEKGILPKDCLNTLPASLTASSGPALQQHAGVEMPRRPLGHRSWSRPRAWPWA